MGRHEQPVRWTPFAFLLRAFRLALLTASPDRQLIHVRGGRPWAARSWVISACCVLLTTMVGAAGRAGGAAPPPPDVAGGGCGTGDGLGGGGGMTWGGSTRVPSLARMTAAVFWVASVTVPAVFGARCAVKRTPATTATVMRAVSHVALRMATESAQRRRHP